MLKEIYVILFITIDIITFFVSVILKKINLSSFLFICVVAKFPEDIVRIVPISVITSILLKLDRLSTIPE